MHIELPQTINIPNWTAILIPVALSVFLLRNVIKQIFVSGIHLCRANGFLIVVGLTCVAVFSCLGWLIAEKEIVSTVTKNRIEQEQKDYKQLIDDNVPTEWLLLLCSVKAGNSLEAKMDSVLEFVSNRPKSKLTPVGLAILVKTMVTDLPPNDLVAFKCLYPHLNVLLKPHVSDNVGLLE